MARREFYQGDEIDVVVTTTTSMGTPTNVKFAIQRDGSALVEKSVGSGLVVDSTTQFTVSLDKADTVSLTPSVYKWQALLIDASSNEKVVEIQPPTVEIKKRLAFS